MINRKKRCDNMNWDKHVVTIKKSDDALIIKFAKPDTICYSITFINTCGIMAVTGDFYNWIFCREFVPSANGYVSDHYWCEKLRISSRQESHIYDSNVARDQIEDMLGDDDREWDEETKEWLVNLKDEACGSEYEYIAAVMNDRPDQIEAEDIPHGKRIDYSLLVIFDAFDEICRRMEAGEIPEI